MTEAFVTRVRVEKVERRSRVITTDRDGSTLREDLGWFVVLQGSQTAIGLGFTEPSFQEGDILELVLRVLRSA